MEREKRSSEERRDLQESIGEVDGTPAWKTGLVASCESKLLCSHVFTAIKLKSIFSSLFLPSRRPLQEMCLSQCLALPLPPLKLAGLVFHDAVTATTFGDL